MFILWKLVFEENLILGVKTTFRLKKSHCKNFRWQHIKNKGSKCYFGNNEQKAMLLIMSRSDLPFGFDHLFFECPIGWASTDARPNNRAPRKKLFHPCLNFSNISIVHFEQVNAWWDDISLQIYGIYQILIFIPRLTSC